MLPPSHSQINIFFRELCKPECGTAILGAYENCGEIDSNNQHVVDFFISLCETNQNGDRCYEMYVSAREHYIAEGACYIGYTTVGFCTCRAKLSEVVDEQGCCLIAHQDFFTTVFRRYDPVTLYNGCGVDRPERCNSESPVSSNTTTLPPVTSDTTIITENSSISQGSTIITITAAMIISFILALGSP